MGQQFILNFSPLVSTIIFSLEKVNTNRIGSDVTLRVFLFSDEVASAVIVIGSVFGLSLLIIVIVLTCSSKHKR